MKPRARSHGRGLWAGGQRPLTFLAVAWVAACGDGTTEPLPSDPPRATTVEVSPTTVQLTALGETVRFSARVLDQNAGVIAGVTVTWSSSDPTVATTDSSGLVTGVGDGEATITAIAGSAAGSGVVTVTQAVATVEVTPSADTIGLSSTLELTAEGFDENGDAVEGVGFSWESSDAAVATVDASGLVTGVAVGTAAITVSAGSGLGTAEITVMDLERAALVALYEATDGPNWVNNENWLTDAPLAEWYGVYTDTSGRVVRLDLSGKWDSEARRWGRHGLSGVIPPELGNLTNLIELVLSWNSLTGPIPPKLSNLAHLEKLLLDFNHLTGAISPELGSLTNLIALDFNANDLSGPIPPEFGNLTNLERLVLAQNDLSGSIPSELGDLTALTQLRFFHNRLTGPIPPELGNLTNLIVLDFNGNDLSGPIPRKLGNITNLEHLLLNGSDLSGLIPSELGDLSSLTVLWLQANVLEGPIPESFLELNALEDFRFQRNADLCAPGTVDFASWLAGIERITGPYCNESDTGVLESLFEAAGGPAWSNAEGWLSNPVLAGWHGVRADSVGRVTALDLSRNRLVGQLPAKLGELAQMTELRIADNPNLSGRLPLSLDRLALRTLHYAGTGLCAPFYTSFGDWLGTIPSHEGTDAECAPLSDREVLEALYDVTGGPDWTHNENWLTDAPLGDWHGVEVDNQGRVVALRFVANRLTGRIPRELGGLTSLRELVLWNNDLAGPIPPELGNLASLAELVLGNNDLTGPIPPELGNLASLRVLELARSNLTGPIPSDLGDLSTLEALSLGNNDLASPIPPELGNLTSLRQLYLWNNDLTGPIPPELGNLASLRQLWLSRNGLTGPIPPELGSLSNLWWLVLDNNKLTGSVPPELGGLSGLDRLSLSNNPGMSGALPTRLTNLHRLQILMAGGTDLCAPQDAGFQSWLQTVHSRRVAPCSEYGTINAYLTQAVQSRAYPVPLVSGEKALLRVFVSAARTTTVGIPPIRARFYLNGTERHVMDIAAKTTPIPIEVDEGSLAESSNAEIPAELVQPGLEMVIEIDPDGTLDTDLGVPRRIPEAGRMAVDVQEMPVFDLTVIPFLWSADLDSAIVEAAGGMAADPQGHELLWQTQTLLPIGNLDVTAHEPVLSSSNSKFVLLAETRTIRAMEGSPGHYLGMMSGAVNPGGGVAARSGRVSFSEPYASTIAHEFGHNLSLLHAPCGGAGGPDQSFPYPDGSIGAWGYDFRASGRVVEPSRPDLMSYCEPEWVSDYHFTNMLRFRLNDEGVSESSATAAQSLLLWGGVNADNVPYLEPAFVVNAPAALPDFAGEYVVTGRTASSIELFSLSFTMPETADGDGSSSFTFVLPVQLAWAGSLASITLSGPDGSTTLDNATDIPMTILLDPNTGQVRGILRDLPPTDAATVAPQPGASSLDVLFSRGIPDAGAWNR